MVTQLGELVQLRRTELEIGVRELARRIDKSPAYVVSLERAKSSPGATDETLSALASALELDPDEVLAAAGRVPESVRPTSGREVNLYRLIGYLTAEEQEALQRRLEETVRERRLGRALDE